MITLLAFMAVTGGLMLVFAVLAWIADRPIVDRAIDRFEGRRRHRRYPEKVTEVADRLRIPPPSKL